MKKARQEKPAKRRKAAAVADSQVRKFNKSTVVSLVAALVLLCVGAYSADAVLRGHVSVSHDKTVEQNKQASAPSQNDHAVSPPATRQDDPSIGTASPQSAHQDSPASELVDSYGTSAMSPAVAAAIRKAQQAPDAKQAADREEALDRGYMKPGTDPIAVILHGYIPPGMSRQQAAMLYNSLPKIPRMPGPITPEQVARMAGEPVLPEEAVLSGIGMDRYAIEAQNQKMLEQYTRERFGPIYVPPLHRDHNRAAQAAGKVANGVGSQTDHQISNIPAQYGYDGGGPGSIREMTDGSGNVVSQYEYDPFGRVTKISETVPSDFGYAGMYVHQRSGLNLTMYRAYSPVLGRWLSRDPIGERAGPNLYAYVANNPINYVDRLGLAYVAWGLYGFHPQIIYEDNGLPPNIGYGPSGPFVEPAPALAKYGPNPFSCGKPPVHYDDSLMRQAVGDVNGTGNWQPSNQGFPNGYNACSGHNCDAWFNAVLDKYSQLQNSQSSFSQ